jgi:transposase
MPRRHLRVEEVSQTIILLREGYSQREVAQILKSVVQRAAARHRTTGSLKRKRGQGANRKTTAREDHYIELQALRKRFVTSRELKNDLRLATGKEISTKTVRRRLKEVNLIARKPATGPILTALHKINRLCFCLNHREWNERQWDSVLFTDEFRFHIFNNDRHVLVLRRPGERYAQCNIRGVDKFGGGPLMVWGGISFNGRTQLVIVRNGLMTAARYRDDIIVPHVLPYAENFGPNFIFMHDNARPHIAHTVTTALRDANIDCLEWPAKSPDLNPIEHLWDHLNRRVRSAHAPPINLEKLSNLLIQEWHQIPQQSIQNLISSMPRRMQECITARGGNTSY